MSAAKLKTRIKCLHSSVLAEKGFVLDRARIPERRLSGLRQGIEFQPGTGHLAGKFTLNVYWSFLDALDDGNAMSASKRVGDLAGGTDSWFSQEDDAIDSAFQAVERLMNQRILPYLDRYDTLSKIVDACSSGELSEIDAFGVDVGWRRFYQGFCHLQLGHTAVAVEHFVRVVDLHSSAPYEWVQRRKRSAVDYLRQLGVEGR